VLEYCDGFDGSDGQEMGHRWILGETRYCRRQMWPRARTPVGGLTRCFRSGREFVVPWLHATLDEPFWILAVNADVP
jgi:hypothetical protein